MSEPQESPAPGSWGSLLSIMANARADAEEAASRPPIAHTCGEPWRTGPDGELYCSFDGASAQD